MKLSLSENEKSVLGMVISDGRLTCTEMGRRIGISSQAVGKIVDKLESSGIVTGYTATVDYERLGVEVFAVGFFRFKSGSWARLEEADIRERLRGPHLIQVMRVVEGDATHMILYGFRSMKELDNYFHILQQERGHISELRKLYVLSASSVLKDSPNELLLKAISELGEEVLGRPEPPKPLTES
ncbi:MAG: winged helix-turn-helix transcriptional regulator [Candidatus Altiarchaeota archaeon]